MRGTNQQVEKSLDEVLASEIIYKGQKYPVIPSGDLDSILAEYYLEMGRAKD